MPEHASAVGAVPETRYARAAGDVDIAYQVFGDQDSDLTLIGLPPVVSNIEVLWEDQDAARFLNRLGNFCRYVHFDKRGQGLSDRFTGVPTLEERVDDVRAVLDAIGAERAAVAGASEGGVMACYFAAAHPERVTSLILFGSAARFVADDDYPCAPPRDRVEAIIELWARAWATPESITPALVAADKVVAGGDPFRRWVTRYERACSTPRAFAETLRLDIEFDVRDVLKSIRVPTLVMHRRQDPMVELAQGRYLADHIPGARLIELDGADHVPWWGNASLVVDEIEEFLTGRRSEGEADRVLATVLFTDVVGSTEQAIRLGDRRWRDVLDDLDGVVAREVDRHRGRLVKSTGDGHLATFDGPARGVRAAAAIVAASQGLGIALRAGLHAGEVELRGDDIGGIGVHIAARVSALASPHEILVSRTVTDLVVGSGLAFRDAGSHALKGVPGEWQLFALSEPAATTN